MGPADRTPSNLNGSFRAARQEMPSMKSRRRPECPSRNPSAFPESDDDCFSQGGEGKNGNASRADPANRDGDSRRLSRFLGKDSSVLQESSSAESTGEGSGTLRPSGSLPDLVHATSESSRDASSSEDRTSDNEDEVSSQASKASELPRTEIVTPPRWSERQVAIGTKGPLRISKLTASELAWWLAFRLKTLALLVIIYASQYFLAAALIVPAVYLERHHLAMVYCAYAVAYSFIPFVSPEQDGRKDWPAFHRWFVAQLEEVSVFHHEGGMRIVRDSDGPLSPDDKYIFGYHPHGLMPAVFAWFPLTRSWTKLFPGIRPIGLVATAIFKVPILRDLALWVGLREVSRTSFIRALDEKRAVVICPGGQSELSLHAHSSKKTFVLSARKTGFIRIALETGSKIVPMFNFGESQLMDNAFDFPAAQRISYKLVGFPIPFLPVGLFGLLPVPRRGNVTLLVGKPFDPVAFRDSLGPNVPEAEQIDRVKRAYYEQVEELFKKHSAKLGFGEWKLVIEQTR